MAQRKEEASAFLAAKRGIKRLTPEQIGYRFGIPWREAVRILSREQLRRGDIQLADLAPDIRRWVIDPANLDLHAIANGPIMDSNEIYLPAGKCSPEEARRREDVREEASGGR